MFNAITLAGRHLQRLTGDVFDRTHNLLLKQQGSQQHDQRADAQCRPALASGEQRARQHQEERGHHATYPPAQRHRGQLAGPAFRHYQPFMHSLFAAPFVECLIKRFDGGNLVRGGFHADGHIAGGLAVAHHRHRVRAHPVMIAIFPQVFHDAAPGFALLQGVPHVGEGGFWHVRVANEVVRLAHQFIQRVTTHLDKGVIGLGNVAVQIGGGHECGVIFQWVLTLCDKLLRRHRHPLQVT